MYNFALSFVLIGQVLVVSIPYLQAVFQTAPLTLLDWVSLMIVTSSVFWMEEARKRYSEDDKQSPPSKESSLIEMNEFL